MLFHCEINKKTRLTKPFCIFSLPINYHFIFIEKSIDVLSVTSLYLYLLITMYTASVYLKLI